MKLWKFSITFSVLLICHGVFVPPSQASSQVSAQTPSQQDAQNDLYRYAEFAYSASLLTKALAGGAIIDKGNYNKDTALYLAVKKANLPAIKELLKAGANINAKNSYDETALHQAALQSAEILQLILSHKPDLNAQNQGGESALHKLAITGYDDTPQKMELLLKAGAKVDLQNTYGKSALHQAAGLGRDLNIQVLLKHGANKDLADKSGYTPLLTAAAYMSASKILVAAGANTKAKNSYGESFAHRVAVFGADRYIDWLKTLKIPLDEPDLNGVTPLMIAMRSSYASGPLALIRHGANPKAKDKTGKGIFDHALENSKFENIIAVGETAFDPTWKGKTGQTIFQYVVTHGNTVQAKNLLDQGAKLDIPDSQGLTPLLFAISNYRWAMAKFLIENGAPVKLSVPATSQPVWAILKQYPSMSSSEVLSLLVEKGADIEWKDSRGATPLMDSLDQNRLSYSTILINGGADVKAASTTGLSVLHIAAIKGYKDIVPLLLQKGADPLAKENSNGATPLFAATMYSQSQVVAQLASHGTNELSNEGTSALFIAARVPCRDCFFTLIDAGADHAVVDKLNQNILHGAIAGGNKEIINWALSKAPDINSKTGENYTALDLAEKLQRLDIIPLLKSKGAKNAAEL